MGFIACIAIAYEVFRWEEKALLEALSSLGLKVKPLHLHSTYIPLSLENPHKDIDLVLQRAISHVVALNSTIAFESNGIKVVNNSMSTAIAMNKLWTLKILSEKGIPIPRTAITFDFEPSFEVVKVLGYPVVLKPIDGSWGRLIAMARDDEELRALLEHRNYIQNPSIKINMIQEYVKKPNRDLRLFVVGDKVVAAMYRISNHWITNAARGGTGVKADISKDLEELAIKTSQAVGGEILGIDIFEHPEKGYIVNEVNAVPEFKTLTLATGIPVHIEIAKYIKNLVKQ